MQYILLLAGFILLIKGADFFVDGAGAIARRFKIPSVIIGLTIVAFGTSAPEASVSIVAAIEGNNGIAVGNVIGSNLFNLLMVVGICAVMRPAVIDHGLMKRDFPFSIAAAAALFILSFDSMSGRKDMKLDMGDGLMLLLLFCIFMYAVVSSALASRKEALTGGNQEEEIKNEKSILINLVMLAAGIAGIIIGGELTVDSASKIASDFGMSDTLIGLTIVAVGTSLPELVTSVMAVRKGEEGLAFGNVIGSNIFNILFILGTSAVISDVQIQQQNIIDSVMLVAVSIAIYAAVYKKKKAGRLLGLLMIGVYIAYMVYAVIR